MKGFLSQGTLRAVERLLLYLRLTAEVFVAIARLLVHRSIVTVPMSGEYLEQTSLQM